MSLGLSFLFSSSVLVVILMIFSDAPDKKEKIQMLFFVIFATVFNVLSLFYVDYRFHYNIVISLFLSVLLNFILYIPIFLFVSTYNGYKDIELSKAEEREAKLLNILNRFK